MLQDIRQSTQGTAAKIVVGIIVISFAFFGIQSILLSGGGNEIAEVNDEEIYPQQLQQSIDTQRRRLISIMGDNLDPAMLETERLRGPALEALIGRKLLEQSAKGLKLTISEREIGAVISEMEQFQADGVFSADLYKGVLSSAGYTPASFKQSLRGDMLINQLRSGLVASEFATAAELEINAQVISEQRDVRFFTIPQEKFVSESAPSNTQLEAYYNDHLDGYQTSESVDIDYIQLELNDFREPVAESAILDAYELGKQDAQYQTQNRVSHILFEAGGSGDISERLATAQQQLAAGVAFSEVAREYSDDMGSAATGGDLGYSSGDVFPPEMEAMIAQLEPGVVSAPLETDVGTHLILVTEREEGKAPELEEMRAGLEETLQSEEARATLLRTVEALKDISFNAADLSTPAEELNLEVKQADAVTKSEYEGLLSNSLLVDAAFSEDVLVSGHNSDVIELAGDRFVVLRVRTHHQQEIQPLEDVRDQVEAAVVANNTRAAVVAAAERALAQLRSGVSVEQFATAQGYDWQVELGVERRSSVVPPEILRRTFELPPPVPGALSTEFIMTQIGDAVVIELVGVSAGQYTTLDTDEQQQLQQLLGAELGSLINNEFQRGLRDSASITVL